MDIPNSNYAEWAQVVVAILALIAGPPTISTLRAWLSSKFIVETRPTRWVRYDRSRSWYVRVRPSARTLKPETISIFPVGSKNSVVAARRLDQDDAGLRYSLKLKNDAVDIDLVRMVRGRYANFLVIFAYPGIPFIQAEHENFQFKVRESSAPESRAAFLQVVTNRLVVMGLYFTIGTTVVLGRLLYVFLVK